MHEELAKWEILDLANEGDLYGLYEAVLTLSQFPDASAEERQQIARKIVQEFIDKGLIELWRDTAEPTGETTDRGHNLYRNTSMPIIRSEWDAIVEDDAAWEPYGFDKVGTAFTATDEGRALYKAGWREILEGAEPQRRVPNDDWLAANL